MDQERAALGGIGVAALLRLGIGRAADDRLGAIGLDLGDLGGRRHFRHEDARADPELLGGEGDRGAVIAARGGGAAGRRRRPREEIVEGAARLERTGRLQAFELERKRRRAGDRRGRLEERRAADVGADARMGGPDVGRGDGRRHRRMRALKRLLGLLGQRRKDHRVALSDIGFEIMVAETSGRRRAGSTTIRERRDRARGAGPAALSGWRSSSRSI